MNEKEKIEFMSKALLRLMGSQLDNMRVSGMSDRSLEQITRNTKREFNDLIRIFNEEIFGIKPDATYKKQEENK